jgi:GalNAc-alpha-(1->4)-GalNAc-alpha-(1->3)-diNAcBac-PP-undecaprenol alpha-1,4-N-acetyl-D-galactosaminyltransferase
VKLCMVAASLAGGGAERALLDTAALLTERGHQVTVLTFENETSDAYPLPSGVSRTTLKVPGFSGGRLRGLLNNLRRIARLRREVAKLRPDVVISYLTRANIICLLALFGTGRPIVATEHNIATLDDAPMQGLWRTLRRRLYSRMAAVVVVSKGLSQEYGWVEADKLSVIYNFLPPTRGLAPETFCFLSGGARHIVGMGRLESEKGFDKLIRAFHLVQQDCPGWKLLVVGEGSLRPELTRLVASLGLEDHVELPGRVANPRTLFGQCDLFVLSSESEGFGLISFDCDYGPREIITPAVSGILVPEGDVSALSRAMKRLTNDDDERARLARGGLEASGRFAPHEMLVRWETLLRRVSGADDARLRTHRHFRTDEAS